MVLHFLLKAFVSRVNHGTLMRVLRLLRSKHFSAVIALMKAATSVSSSW